MGFGNKNKLSQETKKAVKDQERRRAIEAHEARKRAAKTEEEEPPRYEGTSGGKRFGRDTHHNRSNQERNS